MIKIDVRGEQCPVPVIRAKEAIAGLQGDGRVEVLVDNEIAVQNLSKLGQQKGYAVAAAKAGEGNYQVVFTVNAGEAVLPELEVQCYPDAICGDMIVAIGSDTMGEGDEVLGRALLKGFLYALTKAEDLPAAVLFYNRGAFLTIRESDSYEDIKSLEAQGVEILTCGTCLNHYQLAERLAVGSVTNMYTIVEKMTKTAKVIRM